MSKIALMDSRRKDFIVATINKNRKLQTKENDDRITRDIVNYVYNEESTLIT